MVAQCRSVGQSRSKHSICLSVRSGGPLLRLLALAALLVLAPPSGAQAGSAWGSLNNFDCVNDTGVEAHGFDIELDDIHSTDVSYTYDWNHYGVPRITEDSSDPLHPRVLVRYAATLGPGGVWSAYTAVPSGSIAPTDGHLFTDPTINFGGEHFGVGYLKTPTAARYFWLIDNGAGSLVRGPLVNVATPVFNYTPAIPNVAPAAVVAAIAPPPPPAPPPLQFGEAVWVKAIKTTTHNANKVHLDDLVGDAPGLPQPWANGEPEEVEFEWHILQIGGANDLLEGAPEEMPEGDEVITRRYEFYRYIGPTDAESGEAMADAVAPDGVHGVGTVTYNDHLDPITHEWVVETVDLSTREVVGEFLGAQMSAFDAAPVLGLIDNLQVGEVGVPYTERTVIVGGLLPFVASITDGAVPDGMQLNLLTGVLSGTPAKAGVFTFTVEAQEIGGILVSKTYTLTVTGAAPASYTISVSASPAEGGVVSGGGIYAAGDPISVEAVPNPGYRFLRWTEGGVEVSGNAVYTFTASADRFLVAHFVRVYSITALASPEGAGATSGGGLFDSGASVTVVATPYNGFHFVHWLEGANVVSSSASYTFTAASDRTLTARFEPNTPVLELGDVSVQAAARGSKVFVTAYVVNSGTATAGSASIATRKDATLAGKQTGTRAPISLGDIPPGGSAVLTVSFAGLKSGTATLQLTVTYSGGTVTLTTPVTVP